MQKARCEQIDAGCLLTEQGIGKEEHGAVLTEVLQHAVALQLRVSDLVLQQDQLLLVLVLEGLQPPLAVLQLVDQLLLDLNLASQVRQVGLEVDFCRGPDRARLSPMPGAPRGQGTSFVSSGQSGTRKVSHLSLIAIHSMSSFRNAQSVSGAWTESNTIPTLMDP